MEINTSYVAAAGLGLAVGMGYLLNGAIKPKFDCTYEVGQALGGPGGGVSRTFKAVGSCSLEEVMQKYAKFQNLADE